MKYQNVVVPVTNYATSALQETLTRWGEKGYRFVNSVMADNKFLRFGLICGCYIKM